MPVGPGCLATLVPDKHFCFSLKTVLDFNLFLLMERLELLSIKCTIVSGLMQALTLPPAETDLACTCLPQDAHLKMTVLLELFIHAKWKVYM